MANPISIPYPARLAADRNRLPVHVWASALLLVFLVPALRISGLSTRFVLWADARSYFVGLFVLSAIFALGFAWIAFPSRLLSLLANSGAKAEAPWRPVLAVVLPAIYFFAGFTLMAAYNDVIAAWRPVGAGDAFANTIDHAILGTTVSAFVHAGLSHFPFWIFRSALWVYISLFPQIGAGIILLGLAAGRREAFRYVGTILMAYYLSLVAFAILPIIGPFMLCQNHFDTFPASLNVVGYQSFVIARFHDFAARRFPSVAGQDYLIGFPSMHLAQPIILIWAVRRWKKLAIALSFYIALLVPSILLLEQHYFVDLLGGLLVAYAAIRITEWKQPS